MDFFDKTSKVVKEIGNVTKEQTELANLKIQQAYVADSFRTEQFDVSDVLEAINPDLEKMADLTEQISQKDLQVRQHSIEKDRKKAFDLLENEKRKLDRARDMDVITAEEYAEKLEKAQKKYDNFEILKKIQMQYEMDIITKEEYEEKVRNVLQ